MTRFMVMPLILPVMILSGCVASGSNVRWWNPMTWGSGREARKVEKLTDQRNDAAAKVTKEAQRAVHETKFALEVAPDSRAVEVAKESNAAAVSALDQVAGPLTYDETSGLKMQVERLLSENAELRAKGESERALRRTELASATSTIADLNAKLDAANASLKSGFERENSLANELRNMRLIKWGLIGLTVILAAGWLYVRIALGGIPVALGNGMSVLRQKDAAAGELATTIFDGLLNRHEQRRISKHA